MTSFILPFPPSVNTKYKMSKGRRSKGDAVIAWEVRAKNALNIQNVQRVVGRVILEYALDTPDNRGRDAANYEKYVTDFLVHQNILQDDCARYIKGIYTYWNDTQGNAIHITITPVV